VIGFSGNMTMGRCLVLVAGYSDVAWNGNYFGRGGIIVGVAGVI
jgi:hypothetical protein